MLVRYNPESDFELNGRHAERLARHGASPWAGHSGGTSSSATYLGMIEAYAAARTPAF